MPPFSAVGISVSSRGSISKSAVYRIMGSKSGLSCMLAKEMGPPVSRKLRLFGS